MEKIIESIEKADVLEFSTLFETIKESPKLIGVALLKSCEYGCENITDLILDSPVITAEILNTANDEEENKAAIHYAADYGYSSIFSKLHKKGANIHQLDDNGKSALHCAIGDGTDYINIAFILLNNGANVNLQDNSGNTPLHYAAKDGLDDLASLFISFNASLNLQNKKGMTAAHCAAKSGSSAILNQLKENNADLTIVDSNGKTPLQSLNRK